ncbi:archaeosortase/exosortase family protein [Rhodoferax ferrireducens]|uniref:archaeosortase/exosortase family protein n=1 Tax=Rhodoferax ferrireducens TaxID=192843 RepID=UPI000E0D2C58|nr:archaeosortase/exosortase family protein [Rhodoferax ferrireducens]
MSEEFDVLYQLVFFPTVILLLALERVRVFRRQAVQLTKRWTSNIGLFLIGGVITSLVMPVGIYAFAQAQPPGLLTQLGFPLATQMVTTFLLLDLWRYWEHRFFHWAPLLWRIHLVHHTDTQLDVTTSERHHPLEFLLGTAVTMALIVVLGLPAQGIGLYLLTATVVALYSHANLRLPAPLERRLSWLIVTPGVHAVHHSDLQVQTDSNYGSVLTLWDRLFGSYVDPASAKNERFGLSYFHQPNDTGLARVLQQPFLFRSDFSYPDRVSSDGRHAPQATTPAEMSGTVVSPAWREALLSGMTGLVLASLVLWPTLVNLTTSWRNNEAYQYAWLVMPMAVYLLGWHHRQHSLALSPQPDFTGVFVALVAAACWCAAALMNIDVGQQLAIILAMQGIAMSALGWRAYWRLFPTLGLMFLMIPSGDLLQPALRALTVKAIELFAVVAHLPHSVEGFVIFIGEHRYVVVDECSGLAYVTLSIFLGYSFGLLLYRSVFKIAALALFGAFLGIFTNALRVNAIVLMDWVHGSQMELTAHGNIQWAALFVTLALLMLVLSQLKGEATPVAPEIAPTERSGPAHRLAPVVAGLSVLALVGSAIALTAHTPQAPYETRAGFMPKTMLGWELSSPAAAWSVDPQSQTESLTLTYRRDGQDLHVLIVETLTPDAKLSTVRLAPNDKNIWRERSVQRQESCVGANRLTLLHTTWERGKHRELRHAFYAYSIGRLTTDSTLALRAAQGWHRLTGSPSHPRLIGFIVDDNAPAFDDLAAAFRMILSALETGDMQ